MTKKYYLSERLVAARPRSERLRRLGVATSSGTSAASVSGGGVAPSSITMLGELYDVTLSTDVPQGHVLVWDGEKWTNGDQTVSITASGGTITINDVTLNLVHNHDWSEIVNKPNMIEGVLVGNNKLSFKWSNGDIAEVDFSALVNKLDKRVGRYGTASNRPGASEVSMGDMYIDTTLKRTLWVYGTPLGNVAWVDGEGYLYINNSTEGTPQT